MSPTAIRTLEVIGKQLDNNIYPAVFNGGFVMPCETGVSTTKGKVTRDERQRKRRPQTGPRDGTTGRQRPTSEAPSLVCTDLQAQYESELIAVYEAYPKTQVWQQPGGMLLLMESALIEDIDRTARFLVAVPYHNLAVVKGWGFWGVSCIGIEWIGPRHTNFPDGSICAFEPSDGTWTLGDPLIQLLDLYSVWALRHLYLKTLGRWPGYQAIHFPFERVFELRPDEHCGCNHSDRLYSECCQKRDLKRNIVADAVDFLLKCYGGHRSPPAIVTDFVLNPHNPPKISKLLPVH